MSVANFYAIFELYCPVTGTFFTPVGELGMALHEMWEVSALPLSALPYEEYFLCEAELALLEKQEPALFETYRELIWKKWRKKTLTSTSSESGRWIS